MKNYLGLSFILIFSTAVHAKKDYNNCIAHTNSAYHGVSMDLEDPDRRTTSGLQGSESDNTLFYHNNAIYFIRHKKAEPTADVKFEIHRCPAELPKKMSREYELTGHKDVENIKAYLFPEKPNLSASNLYNPLEQPLQKIKCVLVTDSKEYDALIQFIDDVIGTSIVYTCNNLIKRNEVAKKKYQ